MSFLLQTTSLHFACMLTLYHQLVSSLVFLVDTHISYAVHLVGQFIVVPCSSHYDTFSKISLFFVVLLLILQCIVMLIGLITLLIVRSLLAIRQFFDLLT